MVLLFVWGCNSQSGVRLRRLQHEPPTLCKSQWAQDVLAYGEPVLGCRTQPSGALQDRDAFGDLSILQGMISAPDHKLDTIRRIAGIRMMACAIPHERLIFRNT